MKKYLFLLLVFFSFSLFSQEEVSDNDVVAAVRSQNLRKVKELVEINHGNPNARSSDGQTVLMIAVKSRNRQITTLLLEMGANIDESDYNGRSSLIHAINDGNLWAVETFTSKAGININLGDNNRETPLMHAVKSGNFEIVKRVLSYIPNIEAKNSRDQTALMYAAISGNRDIVILLLEVSANRDAKDVTGKTAADLTTNRNIRDIINNFNTRQ